VTNYVEIILPEAYWHTGNHGLRLLRRAHTSQGGGSDLFSGGRDKPIKLYFHGPRKIVAESMERARKMEELALFWWAESVQ
jgi:hypothetical protein